MHVQICCFANLGPSSFFSLFSVVWLTQIFAIFKQKKSNNLVKPFFTWNNSFNLRNEHSNSIVRKTGTKPGSFFTVYCVFCPSKYVNVNFKRHPASWRTRASYSKTSCDFFLGFFFQSHHPTQYQEMHSTLSEKKGGQPKPSLYCFFTIVAVARMGPGSCLYLPFWRFTILILLI